MEIPREYRTDRLRVVRDGRGGRVGPTSAERTRLRRLELVGHHRAWMPRLRMEADVPLPLARTSRHVHVYILEQLGHLRNEDVAPALLLHELERSRESTSGPSR